MEKASEELDFEKATILRDRIKSLNIIQSSQRVNEANLVEADVIACLLYTSPSPRDRTRSRMPSSA